ncbi:MAG: hypothetical protein ACRDHZ_14245, partial [Ktedonobacteraceae bacterium]
MSSIKPALNNRLISAVSGKASSDSPEGANPISETQLLALPRRVLITPSIEVAPPPTVAFVPSVK